MIRQAVVYEDVRKSQTKIHSAQSASGSDGSIIDTAGAELVTTSSRPGPQSRHTGPRGQILSGRRPRY